MKSQSFKLFVVTLIIGIVAVVSAFAQENMKFNVPFDFQVGNEKLDAGDYEMRKLDSKKFLLRNTETKKSIVLAPTAQVGFERETKTEKLVFNRYDKTYFLREIHAERGNLGKEMTESKAERNFRKRSIKDNPQIADNKVEPEKVSINSTQ